MDGTVECKNNMMDGSVEWYHWCLFFSPFIWIGLQFAHSFYKSGLFPPEAETGIHVRRNASTSTSDAMSTNKDKTPVTMPKSDAKKDRRRSSHISRPQQRHDDLRNTESVASEQI
jgi:hypothetical protein